MELKKSLAFTPHLEDELRESLKRCSPETVEAALSFRQHGNFDGIPVIVMGIIERFLEPDVRHLLREGNDDTRLFEDLGVDSLLMVEIIILVEETLDISIANDELRDIRSVGDIKIYLDYKVKGIPIPKQNKQLTVEEIASVMPHQDPFLFIRESKINLNEAESLYSITGDEFFIDGHFKNNPVFPASILIEALGQLAVLYLIRNEKPEFEQPIDTSKVMFASCDGVRCHRICRPGDVLKLKVKLKRIRYPLVTFEGTITVGDEKAVFAEDITLAFDYES